MRRKIVGKKKNPFDLIAGLVAHVLNLPLLMILTVGVGNIALAAGKHEITIQYFANDNQGANNFGVTWAGPGFTQENIPPGNLSH